MDKIIFVVDDSDTNLETAEAALEEHYDVITIPSGKKAIELLEKIKPHLILMDIEMPEMSGFDVLDSIKSNEEHQDIPIIFLTAMVNPDVETKALEMGVVDFITKPFSTPVLLNRVRLHIDISEVIRERTKQLVRAQQDIIFVLADVVENRDEVTKFHIDRTAMFVKLLLTAMKERGVYYEQVKDLSPDKLAESSLLHDVGKITIPDAILNKPSRLTAEEFEIMKTHVLAGKKIIKKVISRSGENVFLYNAKLFATYHHERWDGSGYPYGLKGDNIPLQGRIMAIVDVYDALISKRPYKDAFPDNIAIKIISEESGKHFDPKIVEVFLEIHEQFNNTRRIFETWQEIGGYENAHTLWR